MPVAATSSLLQLFTQGQSKIHGTAYNYHTGGENINATLQRIGWISSEIMYTIMTSSIKITMERVHKKDDLCEKRLKGWLH